MAGQEWLGAKYSFDDADHITPCVYDVKCLDTSEEAEATIAGKPVTGIEPSGVGYPYNATIQYRCPKAMQFSMTAGKTVPTFNYTCQWNHTWTSDPADFPACECTKNSSLS